MNGVESSEKKRRMNKELKRFLFSTLGALMVGFNIKTLVRAGGLFPGGFAGITILIQQIFQTYMDIAIPYTLIYIPLNLIPIYIGFKYLGKKFTLYSVYVIVLGSIMTDLFPTINVTGDVLLICIFGGIINGTAISLCLMVGASGGGTDFISIYFSEKKGIDAWNYIFLANVCILITAGILFGFDRALYSIIFQFCTTQIIQTLFKRYQKHTMLIITEHSQEVYEKIREVTHHDATLFRGIGCFEGVEREMLYSVVGSEEVDRLINAIKEIDPKAFINSFKTEQINGRFYKRPND
ncbi:MAG: YitT family protein [Eubacteriaceae bacterium]|nr:YitT family protein [Eubacteriaceae bacterium]